MRRAPFCGGLARVYHLCVRGGGFGKSVPLVCVWGGVASSHHCLTATVDRWTVSLESLSQCSSSGLRFPLYRGSPCTTVPPVPRFPCTTVPLYHGSLCTMVPPVPWFPLYHGCPCTSVNPALGEIVVRTFKRENPGSIPLAAGFCQFRSLHVASVNSAV